MIHFAENGDVQIAKVTGQQPCEDLSVAVRQRLVAASKTLKHNVHMLGPIGVLDKHRAWWNGPYFSDGA